VDAAAPLDRRTRGVVLAAFVAQGLAIGGTLGAFSLFIRPISEAFDATTLQVSSGISLITLTLAMSGVPVGTWLDRGSPRTVMWTGITILTLTSLAASQATSLMQLAWLCVITGVAMPMLGPLTTTAVVTKATQVERGRALGLANLGVPVGGFSLALVAGTTLESWDWRTTLQCFSAIFFVLGVPVIAWGIPANLGREEAERSDHEVLSDDTTAAEPWTPARLIRSGEFRLIAIALGIGLGTTAGFSAHLAAFLGDLGASVRLAGWFVALGQGCMLIGTLWLGAMADRRSPVSILTVMFLVQLLSFALLAGSPPLAATALLLAANGIAAGGLFPVLGQLLAQRFGAESLGLAMGLANLMMLPFGFGLPMVGGALRDATGSYASVLWLCALLFACGLAVCLALRARLAREVAIDRESTAA